MAPFTTSTAIRLRTIISPLLSVMLMAALVAIPLQADAAAESGWKKIETHHTAIFYQSDKDLSKFNKSLDYGDFDNGFSLLSLFNIATDEMFETVTKKVDAIYGRVQGILDMHRRMQKVTIRVYPDQEQLHRAYRQIYQSPCQVRAWYIFDQNTIYVNVRDLHEGMLAHEMAHSIIDHYLLMSPPAATAEILARYVDANLKNEAIVATVSKPSPALSSFSQ